MSIYKDLLFLHGYRCDLAMAGGIDPHAPHPEERSGNGERPAASMTGHRSPARAVPVRAIRPASAGHCA